MELAEASAGLTCNPTLMKISCCEPILAHHYLHNLQLAQPEPEYPIYHSDLITTDIFLVDMNVYNKVYLRP